MVISRCSNRPPPKPAASYAGTKLHPTSAMGRSARMSMPVFFRTDERISEMAAETMKPGTLNGESWGGLGLGRTETALFLQAHALVPRASLANLNELARNCTEEGKVG